MSAVVIEGATVILAHGMERASIRIEDGVITSLDGPRDGAEVIDATGLMLAPAIVDIHGDAFERQLMPRPGVSIPVRPALLETDRQLAANGIATAYHALTLSWEPGLRSVETGRSVAEALSALSHRLTVENRIQLRWESFCFEAIPLMTDVISGPLAPAIAFNDHTSMAVLEPSVSLQERPFELSPDFPVTDMNEPAFAAKMAERAKRSHMTTEAFAALLRRIWERRPEVPAAIATVSGMARDAGIPMLSHDDAQIEGRNFFRALGAGITEFPMNRAVTEAARSAGDIIVFGAPNAARGGSHLGSPGAAAMIADGLCDVLASDYFYPSMLLAMARLRADGVAPLERLWPLVAANPAAALGLHDRGEIAVGKRADLVLLDWPRDDIPAVRTTYVAGRRAYAATPGG